MLLSLLVTLSVAQTPPPMVEAPVPERLKVSRDGFVPEGYHLVEQPRWAVIGAGLGAFAAGYATTALWALPTQDLTLLVPVAGPLIAMVNAWNWASQPSEWSSFLGDQQFWRGFAAFWFTMLMVSETAVQVGGVVTAIVGASKPAQWLQRNTTVDAEKPRVTVMPMMMRGNAPAIALTGTF
ncbi:MAG: hypothetical protein U0228_06295 [Myxococcaceae bacterium]